MKTLFIFMEPQKRIKNDIGYAQYPLPNNIVPMDRGRSFPRPYFLNISSIIFQRIQQPKKTEGTYL